MKDDVAKKAGDPSSLSRKWEKANKKNTKKTRRSRELQAQMRKLLWEN